MDKYRQKIKNIDLEILKLLEKRFEISKEIGNYKFENKLPVLDKKREKNLYEFYKKQTSTKYQKSIVDVFAKIIENSKKIQIEILKKGENDVK